MIDRQKARDLVDEYREEGSTLMAEDLIDRLEQAIVIDLNDPATENRVADAIRRLAPEGAYVPLSTRYPWRFSEHTATGQATTIVDAVVEALRGSAAVHEAERIPHLVAPLLALAEALEHGALVPGPPPGICGRPAPSGTPLQMCELLAGHGGMHQSTFTENDTFRPGGVGYWHDEFTR